MLARSSWENPDDAAARELPWWFPVDELFWVETPPSNETCDMSSCSLEPPLPWHFRRFNICNKLKSCEPQFPTSLGFNIPLMSNAVILVAQLWSRGPHHLQSLRVRKECWKFLFQLARYISTAIYNEVIYHINIYRKWVANSTCWNFYKICRNHHFSRFVFFLTSYIHVFVSFYSLYSLYLG